MSAPGPVHVPAGSNVKSIEIEATITRADGRVEPLGVISSGKRCDACQGWIAGAEDHECPKAGPVGRAVFTIKSFLRRLA